MMFTPGGVDQDGEGEAGLGMPCASSRYWLLNGASPQPSEAVRQSLNALQQLPCSYERVRCVCGGGRGGTCVCKAGSNCACVHEGGHAELDCDCDMS